MVVEFLGVQSSDAIVNTSGQIRVLLKGLRRDIRCWDAELHAKRRKDVSYMEQTSASAKHGHRGTQAGACR